MALTITEATAINRLLDYLYGRPRVPGCPPITREAAHAAAQLLANHAEKALVSHPRGVDLDADRLAER